MKSAILYSALTQLSSRHYPVGKLPALIYVRMSVVRCHYSDALDRANPRKGETVLNSVPLDEQVRA